MKILGNIVFTNKNLDPHYKKVNAFNEYNSSTWTVKPKENLCILFPSYLKHYVEPNFNKKKELA